MSLLGRLARRSSRAFARLASSLSPPAPARRQAADEIGVVDESAWVDRRAILRAFFDTSGLGLEIGPAHNPLLAKRDGYRVEVVDYTDAAHLRQKWLDTPWIDTSGIEEVDYVTDGRSLLSVIPHRKHYDYIIASHLLEHMPDLLGFLDECEALLKPSGRLVLALPDRRFCFDVFRSVSTVGQVLQAHMEKRSRNAPGVAFDHFLYHAQRDGRGDWRAGAPGNLSLRHVPAEAKEFFDRASSAGDYIDVHAWLFTPSSFRLIMLVLSELGLTGLKEAEFSPTQGCEFFACLSAEGAGCGLDRAALMERTIAESAVR